MLPITFFTSDLFILVISVLLIILTSWLVPGFVVFGFLWVIAFSIAFFLDSVVRDGIIKESK
ncbi:MAG: phage holin family protein [Parcubacteria group bacterium]|nr:phage holin family protein [Parcubacteria group bacterium]